ncbi:MAG TPA: type II toxin-antitoxin system PemK/MazF family toxin [Mycobacteriales bacterium]|nr:type II toxin-antitoxin system PemK/MazF family toxin [Mycobacteriales bacterium]
MASRWRLRALEVVRGLAKEAARRADRGSRPSPRAGRRPDPEPSAGHPARTAPVDPAGRSLSYAPDLDGRADAGEIVWTWVAYEDDPSRGKDRPLLVIGRDGATLYGLMLSSQDDRADESNWLAIGSGAWDREGRASWVRLDRVIELAEDGIRREGAVLDRARFDQVAAALRSDHGWS